MSPIRSLALSLCLVLPTAASVAADTPSGHYRMANERFEVAAGVAIRLWQDSERETYGVVLGEGPFDTEAAVGALDPVDAIAGSAPNGSGAMLLTLVRDRGEVLTLASLIARPGSFSTNGDGSERITVEAGRVRGTWSKPSTEFFERTYELSLQFDLPLTEIADPGQPLPVDGGAPGKAYLAFIEALGKRDAKAVVTMQAMGADMVEILGEESLVEIASMNHPTEAELVGGWIDGERAQLRVKGTHAFGQTVRGHVQMRNVAGIWKVGDGALR